MIHSMAVINDRTSDNELIVVKYHTRQFLNLIVTRLCITPNEQEFPSVLMQVSLFT